MEMLSSASSLPSPLADRFAWLAGLAQPAYVVGGALRDTLLRRAISDVDILVAGDALAAARAFAAAHGATVAILDATDGVARVTWPGEAIACDFAAQAGARLDADLLARDFTINALALPITAATLRGWRAGDTAALTGAVIDPARGLADLAARIIRPVTPEALARDPVRVLRAARFAQKLAATYAAETLQAARAVAWRLAHMPPARITAELYGMLATRDATRGMRLLDDLGALTVIVPPLAPCRGVKQGQLHYWDVFDHSLEVIDRLDRIADLLEIGLTQLETPPQPGATGRVAHPTALTFGAQNSALLARLRAPLAEGQTRLTMLKAAALLHDVGKPQTQTMNPSGDFRFPGHPEAGVPLSEPVLDAWQVGKAARRFILTTVSCHMRPGQIAGPHGVTDKAIRHYFRDAGAAGLDVILFSLADHLAVYGPEPLTPFWVAHRAAAGEMLRRAFEEPQRVRPARFMDGDDLMTRFGLERGPDLGRLLAALDAAQLDGAISTRAEALALAEQLVKGEVSA
jgi:tRNA nucleotidyltransferase/poly(A) polymerase